MQNSANYLSAALTPFVASFVAVSVGWPAAMVLAALAALASVAVLRGQRSLRGVRQS